MHIQAYDQRQLAQINKYVDGQLQHQYEIRVALQLVEDNEADGEDEVRVGL
jgi:hypothetical protein